MSNTLPPVEQKRMVRQIVRALKATANVMFWDLDTDEEDIVQRLAKPIGDGYPEREAIESVIQGVIMSHEDFLGNAVHDQCRMATRAALATLPNAKNQTPPPMA